MDFAQLRAGLLARLSGIAGVDPQPTLARFDALQREHDDPATTPPRREEIAQEIRVMTDDVPAAERRLPGLQAWTIIGCMAGAVIACFALVFWFFMPFSDKAVNSSTKISEFITACAIVMVVCFGSAIICYRLLAGTAAQPGGAKPGSGKFSGSIMPFATLVTILFFGGIALYLSKLEDISSVRATRPILVFTLIVAMLGFGGLLMVRSLFGDLNEERLEKRFRLAREIFLVYSGIFGTIIGFYFGAADEIDVASPPSITLSGSSDTISAQVTGGSAPFTGVLQRTEPKLDLLLQGGGRLLSVKLEQPAGGSPDMVDGVPNYCGIGGTITVIDGRGRRASADVTGDLFGKDTACGITGPEAGNASAETPPAEGNAAGT